jgi:hypothetical protein
MAGITYPKVRVCYGQLSATQVNVGSDYGTVILPADGVVATKATITLTSVQVAEYVVIDGITYTAAAATAASSREFINTNDNTAATALATCINHATAGVPRVSASASSNIVTLTTLVGHPLAVTMSPSAATIVCVAAVHPGVTYTGDRQIRVIDAWIRAIGGTTAGCSAIELQTTAATPIVVISWPVANIARDVVARVGVSNTVSTNVGLANAPGVGLKLAAITDMSGATAVDYCIQYTIGRGNTAT